MDKPAFDPNQPFTPIDEGSDLEDVGRGAAQGLTLGTAPVISGAIQATMEKIAARGDEAPEEWKDLYRKYQQASKSNFDASQKRSPYLFGGGEVLGALAPSLLSSGAGLAATGARGVAEAGALGAGKSLAEEIGAGALSGAAQGGIMGAAESKSNLIGDDSDISGVASDALKSAGLGAALGGGTAGAFGAAGQGLTAAQKRLEGTVLDTDNVKLFRQLKLAASEGAAGRGFSGQANQDARIAQQVNTVDSVTNKLLQAQDNLGKNISNLTQQAADNGVVLVPDEELVSRAGDLSNLINSKKGLLGTQQTEQVDGLLQKYADGTLNPAEAYNLRKTVSGLYDPSDREVNNIVKNFSDGLTGQIEDHVPGFTDALGHYNKFSTALESLSGKGYASTPGVGWGTSAPKLQSGLGNIVNTMGEGGSISDPTRMVYNQFAGQLKTIEQENPGLLDSIGVNAPEVLGKIQNQSDLNAVRGAMDMFHPQGGLSSLITGTSKGLAMKGAEVVGRITSPPKIAQSLYAASDDMLQSVAHSIASIPETKFLGGALTKALDNKDYAAKNAVLFAIMQNPNSRQAVAALLNSIPGYLMGEDEKKGNSKYNDHTEREYGF